MYTSRGFRSLSNRNLLKACFSPTSRRTCKLQSLKKSKISCLSSYINMATRVVQSEYESSTSILTLTGAFLALEDLGGIVARSVEFTFICRLLFMKFDTCQIPSQNFSCRSPSDLLKSTSTIFIRRCILINFGRIEK